MVKYIDALLIRSHNVEATVAFYRSIGLALEREQHEKGPLHYTCELGQAHFAIYRADEPGRAPERYSSGATMVGFQVESVEASYEAALRAGAKSLVEPSDFPWGRRALVLDPDGRVVEFNRAPHQQA